MGLRFCSEAGAVIFAHLQRPWFNGVAKLYCMKYSKWIGLAAVLVVIITCYRVWVFVPAAQLSIGGMFASGPQNFGKPGLMNIFFSFIAAIMFVLPAVWAKRLNFLFCGLNIAWAIRNYLLLSRCYGGECPQLTNALYILLAASGVMVVMCFLADVKVSQEADGTTSGSGK